MFGFGSKKKEETGETKLEASKRKEAEEKEAREAKEKEELRKKKDVERKQAEYKKQQEDEKRRVEKEAAEQMKIKKRLEAERQKEEKAAAEKQSADNLKKQQDYAFSQLEAKLLKLSAQLDDINEIQKRIKMQSNNVVEVDNFKYKISAESKKALIQKIEKEKVCEEIYNKLKEFDGKKCNLMVSNGQISEFFSRKLRNINSTRWKFFYPIISDDYYEMKEYKAVNKHLYSTKMKKMSYEQGKFKFLKHLQQIDLLLLGGDIKIPSTTGLVAVEDKKILITKEFIKKYVKDTTVVPINNKVESSISGASKIDATTNMEMGLWQKLMSKIKG